MTIDRTAERQALENALRERVQAAKEAHRVAREEHARLLELAASLSPNNPDSGLATRQALRIALQASHAAFQRHRQILKEFTDFTVRGIPPKDTSTSE